MSIDKLTFGKRDARLEYLLEKVKEGVTTFVEAIHSSPDDCPAIGFRLFTLNVDKQEEADKVFDISMTAVAIELSKQASELTSKYTFYHEKTNNDARDEFYLTIYCRKEAPPTKEEVDKLLEKEMEESNLPLELQKEKTPESLDDKLETIV